MSPGPMEDESSEFTETVEEAICCSSMCDPHKPAHRYSILVFICFISFGSYFCYDNPAALQETMISDLKITKEQFMQFYAWYSWPNVVLCFFGGFLIDRVFGIRLGTIIFALFVTAGQIIFGLGAYFNSLIAMEAGRFVFGIGGESLAVAQNTYTVGWFKGAELNAVFGLQLSFSRVGSTVNMNIMLPIYKFLNKAFDQPASTSYKTLGYSLLFGSVFCLLSLFCALMMAYFDRRASRILKKEDAKTGEVVRITDVKDFPMSAWLIFIICVSYYVAVFPFISLGLVFFEAKYDLSPSKANICNSLVYFISAGASPLLGYLVDKTGRNLIWLIVAVFATLLSHVVLALTFWSPFIPMSVMGVAYSLLACALWPLVAMVIPQHQLGTAYGFMQSIQNLGLGVIAILAGKIVDSSGYLVLEVFFCIWLCICLVVTVLLYAWDSSKGGVLNYSASQRELSKLKKEAMKDVAAKSAEQEPLIKSQSGDFGVRSPIRAATAGEIRTRFLAKVGGTYLQMPETFRTSAFVYPHVLR
eukprot:gene5634-6330_t